MTLLEFFEVLGENKFYVIAFFVLIPVTALIAGVLGKNEGHLSPWKYLYSTLIFLVCIPGVFAITLNVYKFLFQRGDIMQIDIISRVLPIISMVITFLIIRGNTSLDRIPGFGKLSGLVTMIMVLFSIMWFLEHTHIIVFSVIPIGYFLLILIGLLVGFRYGWSRMMRA